MWWNTWSSIVFIVLAVLSSASWSDDTDLGKNIDSQWNQMETSVSTGYAAYEKREVAHWQDYQKRIKQKWADGAIPEQKKYVQYFDDDTTRVTVDYEHGTVTAEALLDSKDGTIAKQKIQDALLSVIGKDADPASVIAKDEVDTKVKPNTAVFEEETSAGDGKVRTLYRITLQTVPDFVRRRAEKFKPLVDVWAGKYHLDSAYVLAIIRQESAFNPRARSWVPAIGLMQIVPHYAGQEVLKVVTGRAAMPDDELLYDPAKNIMIGTVYLQLLRDQYFPDIKDVAKQTYLMTASYNWGPHRLKKAITQGRIPASASSDDTFNIIQNIAPEETKDYVRKVSQYTLEFKKEGL